MLECHACLQRCLRALLSARSPALQTHQPRFPRRIPARYLQTQTSPSVHDGSDPPLNNYVQRQFKRAETLDSEDNQKHGNPLTSRPPSWQQSGEARKQSKQLKEAWRARHDEERIKRKKDLHQKKQLSAEGDEEINEDGDPTKTDDAALSKGPNERHLRTEMKWLKDPAKLAEHVRKVLEKDDHEKALALCRLSSKAVSNVVSWNHLINWSMRHGKTGTAMKIFNEMKKRAQRPDSYTYLLLLRGFAEYAHLPNSLGRALALYHNMWSQKAWIQPSIIHANAVLKVCARAQDPDSMWDIASNLPEKGSLAPDSTTFTTVLNSIRMESVKLSTSGLELEDIDKHREEMTIKGRQLWSLIVYRWQKGEIWMDEKLVSAMGRLLLVRNNSRDWDDVLSLVQQTMNIPRPVEKFSARSLPEPSTSGELLLEDSTSNFLTSDKQKESEEHEGKEFDPIVGPGTVPSNEIKFPQKGQRRGVGRVFEFAKPNTDTLSMLVEACAKLGALKEGREYFDRLTSDTELPVKPDPVCIQQLMRLLKAERNSSAAVEVIQKKVPEWDLKLNNQAYRQAMFACSRDRDEEKRMTNANAVFEAMESRSVAPDSKTLIAYLDTAKLRARKDPNVLLTALEKVHPCIHNLRSLLNFGSGEGEASVEDQEKKIDSEEQKEQLTGPQTDVVSEEGSPSIPQNSSTSQQNNILTTPSTQKPKATTDSDERNLIPQFFAKAISCYDHILDHTKNPYPGVEEGSKMRRIFLSRKKALSAYVTRFKHKREWVEMGGINWGWRKDHWRVKNQERKEKRRKKAEIRERQEEKKRKMNRVRGPVKEGGDEKATAWEALSH